MEKEDHAPHGYHPLARALCNDWPNCPQIMGADRGDDVLVQGDAVQDAAILAEMAPPPGEMVVRLPGEMLRRSARAMAQTALTDQEFVELFKQFTDSVFRLETRDQYLVSSDDKRYPVFRDTGRVVPRTIESSSWLRLISMSTANGKRWQRVHVVGKPLTTYLRFELLTDQENVAAGEEVRIADRDAHPELGSLSEDFWLFDAETDHASVVLMRYDEEGHYLGADRTQDSEVVARCRAQRDLARALSAPLASYLEVQRLEPAGSAAEF